MEEVYKPKVVLALIQKDGRFVLIRRRLPAMKVEWAFPGGVTMPNETDEEAAVREAMQEVGMKVAAKQKLLERKHPNTMVLVSYVSCEPLTDDQPVVGEPDELSEAEWVSASEVLTRFTSDVHPTIRNFVMSFA